VAPVFPLRGGMLVLFSIQLLCLIFIRSWGVPQERFPCQGRCPPLTRPDTIEDDGDVDWLFSDRCSSGSGAVWGFCLGVFRASFGFLSKEGFPSGCPWAPSRPLWGLGASGSCVEAALFLIPSLILVSTSSADFGACPGNHLASVFQVYPFAVVQCGPLHLLGESIPALGPRRNAPFGPPQVCPERWVADSLQSPASPP
jgi:hypothetical protein